MNNSKSLGTRLNRRVQEPRARIPWIRRRLVQPVVGFREIRFPTFTSALHQAIAPTDNHFRSATLGGALGRLRGESIPCAMPEVSVSPGNTSSFSHEAAPDLRVYLLDTFEGFPPLGLPAGIADNRFRGTSTEAVSRGLDASPKGVLKPGHVPESLQVLSDERFAFILLDPDRHRPTRASLELSYRRLSTGGYLVVQDYNHPGSDWARKRALDRFLCDRLEQQAEIGDVWGSALRRPGR
jgi:O-methyltransferase